MGRPKRKQVELRSYDLTDELHLVIHRGAEWRISPVESLILHFHNCFEIGACLTESGLTDRAFSLLLSKPETVISM